MQGVRGDTRRRRLLIVLAVLVMLSSESIILAEQQTLALPRPNQQADGGLNALLERRRTQRAFAAQPLSLATAAELLWAAQGETSPHGQRTAPSAGALYPLELRLVVGQVAGLSAGIYHYQPAAHALIDGPKGDMRGAIAATALRQDWIAQAPAIVVISAVEGRTTAKYGRRGIRYVHMEVGHAAQNLLLQAVANGLAAAIVGAFDDDRLARLLKLPDNERPLAVLPVGHPR